MKICILATSFATWVRIDVALRCLRFMWPVKLEFFASRNGFDMLAFESSVRLLNLMASIRLLNLELPLHNVPPTLLAY